MVYCMRAERKLAPNLLSDRSGGNPKTRGGRASARRLREGAKDTAWQLRLHHQRASCTNTSVDALHGTSERQQKTCRLPGHHCLAAPCACICNRLSYKLRRKSPSKGQSIAPASRIHASQSCPITHKKKNTLAQRKVKLHEKVALDLAPSAPPPPVLGLLNT